MCYIVYGNFHRDALCAFVSILVSGIVTCILRSCIAAGAVLVDVYRMDSTFRVLFVLIQTIYEIGLLV